MKQIGRYIIGLLAMVGCYGYAWGAENTMTGIFSDRYRTLTVAVEGNRLAPPVLTMGSDDRLVIGFDELGDERSYLRYSIYHCGADWRLSDLVDNEVFNGFNYADVTDYAFSRATTVHYVHYSITLPNEEYEFLLSGNYLLRVYEENEPDETLLQVRFMVSEGAANVRGLATSRTDEGYNSHYQQLEIEADMERFPVRDMYNDLKLVVSQNGRVDNQVMVTHPSRVNGKTAVYEHQRQLIFPAGNEYRRIETVQMTYPGMGIEYIDYKDPYYHHVVKADYPRFSGNYYYDQTQHGRFFVREYNSTDSDMEADYSVVHFTLDMTEIPGADVYIDGDMAYRHFDDSSRMHYDSVDGVYRKAMFLKQGAYNYQYLVMPRNAATTGQPFANEIVGQAYTSGVEGDFYQTVNEYLVLVYYRAPGDRYDRLLGYTMLRSGR